MELDSRILEGKKPLDCFDTKIAEQFLGKKGYFSDYLNEYTHICNTEEDVLQSLDEHHDEAYITSDCKWELFLPAEWVKEPEKKYRAFTNEEFVKLFDSGKLHSIRRTKETDFQIRYIITSIYTSKENNEKIICIKFNGDDFGYSLDYLFRNFEYFDGIEWKPFGVEK